MTQIKKEISICDKFIEHYESVLYPMYDREMTDKEKELEPVFNSRLMYWADEKRKLEKMTV